MTWAEIEDARAGFEARHELEMDRLAWVVAHLLQPHMKKGSRMTVEKLRPRKAKK